MNTSRYLLIDERQAYPVKRRARGARDGEASEPAVTLLPPDPYLIMERPGFARSPSPTMYRAAPPKSAKNKEASSFVILGETVRTPVQSRPGSPSGRVSPFRGRGFKSPTSTRPNSRVPSPAGSPRKVHPARAPVRTAAAERPRIGRDIGLPPKSPMKSKPQKAEVKPTQTAETSENAEVKDESENSAAVEEKESTEDLTASSNEVAEPPKEKPPPEKAVEEVKPEKRSMEPAKTPVTKRRLTASVPQQEKKPPASPRSKTKSKPEKSADERQSGIKKTTKPPVPPKKIGLKTTLKTEETTNEQNKKNAKEVFQGKSNLKENGKEKPKEKAKENGKEKAKEKGKENGKENPKENGKKAVEEEETTGQKNSKGAKEKEAKEAAKEETKERGGEEKPKEEAPEGGGRSEGAGAAAAPEASGTEGQKPERPVPCFQPDKCQIAPPTMASPSPIITPTMSTPSTTADLASSSMKNSQSIAAAPTTVTPSSLSSVSSTVVLTGNLVRKEIEIRNRSKEAEAGVVLAKETRDPSSPEKVSVQMVKAGSRDSIKWSNRDSLSGEITSTTEVIKGEAEMEVLSPNNLRESPPRMPPPNVAWDEGRLPNGDVPSKSVPEGKFRRFVTTIWRFLCYLFCCRCRSSCKCCRRSDQERIPKPSIFSRMNCCKSCRNPFKDCSGCCKGSCCKCSRKKCCRRNRKEEKPKPKPNPKPRKHCAKEKCCCKGCCDAIKALCLNVRYKINNLCRSLFCLNTTCCQNFLRKFKCCHKLKCCQKDGFCSCCNPNVKKDAKKLNKKGSRASNNSRDKDNLDVVLVEHTSLMKAAIPVLPSCLAIFCLILNLFLPGFGTFVSGILCLCFGKPRFSVKDTPKNRVGSFIVNTIIGVAQLFTVVFCLVGWGWSVWWGVIMYKLSRRQKRLKLAEKNQKEAEASNVNHNHVDVEQG